MKHLRPVEKSQLPCIHVHRNMMAFATKVFKGKEKHMFFISWHLRHWALCMVADASSSFIKHLQHLQMKLDEYLHHAKDPLLQRLQRKSETSFPDNDDDDDSYVPPDVRNQQRLCLPQSGLPGLSAKSYPAFFEMLMHLTLASCSRSRHTATDAMHDGMLKMYSSLVRMYIECITIFPRQFIQKMLQFCKEANSIIMIKVQAVAAVECGNPEARMHFKTSQQRDDLMDSLANQDPTQDSILATLVNGVKSHVLQSATSLSESVLSILKGASPDHISSKATALKNHTEKALENMDKLLCHGRQGHSASRTSPRRHSSKRKRNEDFVDLNEPASEEDLQQNEGSLEDEGDILDFSDSTDSFGVTGDWGSDEEMDSNTE